MFNFEQIAVFVINKLFIFQMELEKIRAADTQVRWQDDEDVNECRNCKANFTVTRRKVVFIGNPKCIGQFKTTNIPFSSITVVTAAQFTARNA